MISVIRNYNVSKEDNYRKIQYIHFSITTFVFSIYIWLKVFELLFERSLGNTWANTKFESCKFQWFNAMRARRILWKRTFTWTRRSWRALPATGSWTARISSGVMVIFFKHSSFLYIQIWIGLKILWDLEQNSFSRK